MKYTAGTDAGKDAFQMINWKSVRRMPVQRAFYPNVTENSTTTKPGPLKN
jgi:hypothetical protein